MLGRQRRAVAALAAREREAHARSTLAKVRLDAAKARFLANPVNLLLPFTAGALGGALALHRKPGRGPRRESVAWSTLYRTATTLWGLSLPLREALLDARAAAVAAETRDEPDVERSAFREPVPREVEPPPPRESPPPPRQPVPPA